MNKLYRPLLALVLFAIIAAVELHFVYLVFASNEGQVGEAELLDKERINIVLLGIEDKARADAIMLLSYDQSESELSVLSIPRDTYFYEAGYNNGDQRKINAVYGREKEKGYINAISKLLNNTPVDYYVSVDYEGVAKIIDTIDGIELEVPIDMAIGDIKFTKGKQVLHGREALGYLRFRETYPDGDIGRIKAQQKLLKAVLSKVKYSHMTNVIDEAFNSIKTNMSLEFINEYTRQFISGDVKEVTVYILPGTPKYKYIGNHNWSYFFHNPQQVNELMEKIYE